MQIRNCSYIFVYETIRNMKNKDINIRPTASELEILNILWAEGHSTVREVNQKVNLRKKTGYTTTLKLMQIMADKGLVERKLNDRTHIYSALAARESTLNLMLDNFLENTFGGSAMGLVMQALGNHKATGEELEELKKLIDRIEKGERDANTR